MLSSEFIWSPQIHDFFILHGVLSAAVLNPTTSTSMRRTDHDVWVVSKGVFEVGLQLLWCGCCGLLKIPYVCVDCPSLICWVRDVRRLGALMMALPRALLYLLLVSCSCPFVLLFVVSLLIRWGFFLKARGVSCCLIRSPLIKGQESQELIVLA